MKKNTSDSLSQRLSLLVWLCTITCALAQPPPSSVIVVGSSGPRVVLPPGVELPPGVTLPGDVVSSSFGTNASSTNASPADKRLQELLKLKFDRTAANILSTLAERFDGTESTNEVEQFEQNVIAGDWPAVGAFLRTLPGDQGKQVYRDLIRELTNPSRAGNQPAGPVLMDGPVVVNQNPNQPGPASQAGPTLVVDDILKLAEIAPHDLEESDAKDLGRLLSRLLRRGDAVDPLVAKLDQGVKRLGGSNPEDRRRAAELLLAANQLDEAVKFFAPVETARAQQDWRALEQHARDLMARGLREKDSELLKQAWEVNQFILASRESGSTNREPALRRCLELIPQITQEVGTNWLRESFRADPGRGLAILSAVSLTVQSGLNDRNANQREKNLEAQKQAVDLFLSVADPNQPHWRAALNLLAQGWMQEGAWSKQRYQPRRNYSNPIYDQFGNIVSYQSYPQYYNDGNQVPPIAPEDIVASAPGENWLPQLDDSLRLAVLKLVAELHMKTDTPDKALPCIEAVAAAEPDEANNLANSLLRAWATARNPLQQQQQYQQRIISSGGMVYYSGSPGRPSGISLTRAMQVRNIEELAGLLRRLKALKLTKLNDNAIVGAFTSAHSPAEVFRTADIEAVFGGMDTLELDVLAGLAQAMRERLAQQWRSPRMQQQMKTERKDKEIDAEVLRGYETVMSLLDEGLKREPDNWKLNLARATTLFDLAEFQYGQKVDLEIYVEKREEAFASYEHAANLYADALPKIPEKEQEPEVYRQWFNANLGASDLAYVTRQQEPETNQLARIRTAILALPGDAAERHMSAFAKVLGQNAGSIRAELKPRYLRAGLVVAGDHPDAEEARKLVTYYSDLLREIEFVVKLDGDEVVGHSAPFGVFVSLRHTSDIEREAGGFARYLRNLQKSSTAYYYNPAPQQQRNFVEDFDHQVREKLVDKFDVKSITFLDEKTKSRGYGRDGWRETPMAYLLLQAKDGAVDQLPTFQMDLDFFDSSGAVVLPVQSQITLIDARPEGVPVRPVRDVEITQILDDRDLASGELTLEVKATGKGIVPDLGDLLRADFNEFSVTETNDLGVTVTQIDTEGDDVAAVTERNWLFKIKAPDNAPASLAFHFPTALREDVKTTYKRYSDADLVEVEPAVALAGLALRPRPWWHWLVLGVVGLAVAGGGFWWSRRHQPTEAGAVQTYALPENTTPFALISLLRRMAADETLPWSEANRTELTQTIKSLERHYFARERNGDPTPNLQDIGRRWVSLAGDRHS